MKRLKVVTIVGTRPEIIRLSQVIKKLDIYFEHILVHTGQNYDKNLNDIFFEDLNLKSPNYYLNAVGGNLGETIGNIIAKSYKLLSDLKPDALLILGDTNSALSAISAKRLKIPIFHMEAGNRCFDENLPEETNRKIVDHIADVNLCYSEHARRYLALEGRPVERTFVTGSPIAEVLTANIEKIKNSAILDNLKLTKNKYILLSAHREENIDNENNFFELMETINKIAETYNIPVIYSVHPRSQKFISERKFVFNKNVQQLKPFNFTDYNNLQINAFCVISDSGTIPEEASYFKFPAVSIRTSTERPEALDKGSFIIGSLNQTSVLQAVNLAVKMKQAGDVDTPVPDYREENVSTKVVKIIQSYVEIVNKKVWNN